LALITHTHLLETWKRIQKVEGSSEKRRGNIPGLVRLLKNHRQSCLICERLECTVRGYGFAVAYLWDKDPQFQRDLLASNGFCLPHLAVAHESAEHTLSRSKLSRWRADIAALQRRTIQDLEAQLKSFTERYDYRSTEPQPEDEKTVLPRAIRKMSGRL
jgi:hypothetical protein